MREHNLTETHAKPSARRVGRGISAGGGKTAGRGTKGQKSRTGANSNIPRTFEGGSTPLVQKLPKLKGFKSHREKSVSVSLSRLIPILEPETQVTIKVLLEKGLISLKEVGRGIKIIGGGTTTSHSLTVDTEDSRLTTSKKLFAKD